MSKEKKVFKCSDCGGKLHKLGTIGPIRYSRCESCGQEHTKTLKKASLDMTISSNNLRECITCKSKYAAVTDPDLCPDCHSSFTGKAAATVTLSAPVNCEFCSEQNMQVQASYDAKTKLGSWAFVCEKHLSEYGIGLGKNSGRKLVVDAAGKKIRNMEIGETEEFEVPMIQPVEVPGKGEPVKKEEPLFIPEEWPTEAPQEPLPSEPEPEKTPEVVPVEPEKVPVGIQNGNIGETEEFETEMLPETTKEKPLTVPDEWETPAPAEPTPSTPEKTPAEPVKRREPEKVPVGRDKKLVNASDNAYPNAELSRMIQQQRQDTSRWQDGENHSPNPNVDPSTLKGDSSLPPIDRVSETSVDSGPPIEGVIARVFSDDENLVEGAKVLLQDGPYQVVGRVVTEAEDGFLVEWRTGRKSIEKKANFELMVVVGSYEGRSDYWLEELFDGDPVNGYHCKDCEFSIPAGSTPEFIDTAAESHAEEEHGYEADIDSDDSDDYDEDDDDYDYDESEDEILDDESSNDEE